MLLMLSEHKTNAMKKRFSCRAAKIWNEQDEDAGTEIVNELNLHYVIIIIVVLFPQM
jgi:hypothetical protein